MSANPSTKITPANQFRSTFIYGVLNVMDNSTTGTQARAAFQRDVLIGNNLFLGTGAQDASGHFLDSTANIQYTFNKEIVNFPVTSLRYIRGLTGDVQQQIIDLSNNITNNGGQSSNIVSGHFTNTDSSDMSANAFFQRDVTVAGNLTVDGSINYISATTFDKISYLSTVSSDVQTQINSSNSNISTLQNKTIDILWTSGQTNKTTIRNHCETDILTFSNTINNIPAYVFSFLSGISSNVQEQLDSRYRNYLLLYTNINDLSQKITDISWEDNKTTINNQCETTTLSFSNMLNNISATTFSYLSGMTSNIQEQLNALKFTNPVGMVISFAGTSTTLTGYLLCDGSSYYFQQYPYLFGVIGYTYGDAGNGYFRVPNYKGIFLRGAGQQDVAGKTYTAPDLGTTVLDKASSFETNRYVDNITTGTATVVTGSTVSGLNGFHTTSVVGNVNFSTSFNIYNYGYNENRPVHTSVQYFIKY